MEAALPVLESCVSASCDYRVELTDYVRGNISLASTNCPKCDRVVVSFCPACKEMTASSRFSREQPVCNLCKANVYNMLWPPSVQGDGPKKPPRDRMPPKTTEGDDGPTLSPRENAVLTLLAVGRGNKEVAAALAISVKTVETYRARIMLKLNTHSIVEIVHYAIANKLIPLPQSPYSKFSTQSADLPAKVFLQ
jgi:DNA-binding CsgD family transcriptional regulator